ncbi:MAG: signal peptidase I [Flavobacteriales bacterium]
MKRLSIPKRRKPYLKAWWWTLFWTVLLVLFLALVVLRFFFVEGRSMRETLLPGDFVFIDKLGYGARLPQHPVGIPYSDRFYLSSVELPYIRLPGFTGIQRMDVLAFDSPMGPAARSKTVRRTLMKRCVGLPGDTLAIRGGKVFVNGKQLERPPQVVTHYHMKAISKNTAERVFKEYGIRRHIRLSNRGDHVVPLTEGEARKLRRDTAVRFVKHWEGEASSQSGFFPRDPEFSWGPGKIGPLWIPDQGSSIALDTSNLPLYERIIEVYEGHELSVQEDGTIRIDGKERTRYTFSKDYFYVLGDSRPYSKDSRVWGFLPEDHVIGRAIFVLFSYDMREGGGGFRWDRTFQAIP